MSETKRFPTSPSNPVTRYFSWNGAESDGYISYWDKAREEEVVVDFPFVFLPLKKLACISGFNKQQEENIYSNEVDNISNEVLNVRVGKNTLAQGLYNDIKDTVKAKGGKYTSSVYIAFKDGSEALQIGNIKFKGASLGPWIDLQNSPADLSSNAVVIQGARLDDSGAIHFNYPVMDTKEVSEETNREADKLYETLNEYVDWKIERNEVEQPKNGTPPKSGSNEPPVPQEETGPPNQHPQWEEDIEDDLPF